MGFQNWRMAPCPDLKGFLKPKMLLELALAVLRLALWGFETYSAVVHLPCLHSTCHIASAKGTTINKPSVRDVPVLACRTQNCLTNNFRTKVVLYCMHLMLNDTFGVQMCPTIPFSWISWLVNFLSMYAVVYVEGVPCMGTPFLSSAI